MREVLHGIEEFQLKFIDDPPPSPPPESPTPSLPPSPLPPSLPPPHAPGARCFGCASGDPHIAAPHGGRFDFRGEDHALYCFHSSRNLTLNVMTEFADFELHDEAHPKHKDVHGSFLTQAHVVARTCKGRVVNLSFYADVINWYNVAQVNGTIDGALFLLNAKQQKTIDDVSLKTDYSTLHVTTREFEIKVTPIYLGEDTAGRHPNELNVRGVHHRLDVQVKNRVAESELSVAPHGVIGQGWDGDGLAIDGEQDRFPFRGEFTTSAMGRGALEGEPDDYKVSAPYDTNFKYSRFDKVTAAPRDVSKLVADGVLNLPKEGATLQGFVGSTEYKHVEL